MVCVCVSGEWCCAVVITHGCMREWMDGRMWERKHGCMCAYGRMHEGDMVLCGGHTCMDACVYGWMDVRMDARMDVCIDAWMHGGRGGVCVGGAGYGVVCWSHYICRSH